MGSCFFSCRPSESWGPGTRTAVMTPQRVHGPQLSLGRQVKQESDTSLLQCCHCSPGRNERNPPAARIVYTHAMASAVVVPFPRRFALPQAPVLVAAASRAVWVSEDGWIEALSLAEA